LNRNVDAARADVGRLLIGRQAIHQLLDHTLQPVDTADQIVRAAGIIHRVLGQGGRGDAEGEEGEGEQDRTGHGVAP